MKILSPEEMEQQPERDSLFFRIQTSTRHAGSVDVMAYYKEPDGDWVTVDSRNPFTRLYLDYRQYENITPELFKSHGKHIYAFWNQMVRSLEQEPGPKAERIIKAFGGGSEQKVRERRSKIKEAIETLASKQRMYSEYKNLDRTFTELFSDMVLPHLEGGREVGQKLIQRLLKNGKEEGFFEEEIAIHIQQLFKDYGYSAKQEPVGNRLLDQLLYSTWIPSWQRQDNVWESDQEEDTVWPSAQPQEDPKTIRTPGTHNVGDLATTQTPGLHNVEDPETIRAPGTHNMEQGWSPNQKTIRTPRAQPLFSEPDPVQEEDPEPLSELAETVVLPQGGDKTINVAVLVMSIVMVLAIGVTVLYLSGVFSSEDPYPPVTVVKEALVNRVSDDYEVVRDPRMITSNGGPEFEYEVEVLSKNPKFDVSVIDLEVVTNTPASFKELSSYFIIDSELGPGKTLNRIEGDQDTEATSNEPVNMHFTVTAEAIDGEWAVSHIGQLRGFSGSSEDGIIQMTADEFKLFEEQEEQKIADYKRRWDEVEARIGSYRESEYGQLPSDCPDEQMTELISSVVRKTGECAKMTNTGDQDRCLNELDILKEEQVSCTNQNVRHNDAVQSSNQRINAYARQQRDAFKEQLTLEAQP